MKATRDSPIESIHWPAVYVINTRFLEGTQF